MVVERPVFPKAAIQNENLSILILASAERRVSDKPDVEWQVFERGKCPESGHSHAVFGDVASHLKAAFLKLVKASFHTEILIQDFPYVASSIVFCTVGVTAMQKL